MDDNLLELEKIIASNRNNSIDFNKKTLTMKSNIAKILLLVLGPLCIILNIEIFVVLDIGLLPGIIALTISVLLLSVLYLIKGDYLLIDFKKQIIEKKNFLKLQRVNFNEIQKLELAKIGYNRIGSSIYYIAGKTLDGKINFFYDRSETVCTEVISWFNKNYIKKN